MTGAELLVDAFGRVRGVVHRAVGGLSPEQLAFQVDPEANSIAWLVWHLTRIQDDHVAGVAGTEQVWTSQGWVDRFGLPFDPLATGYGHRLVDADLDRVVDRSWDPPVTLGVRLVSVIADDLQHAGQAAFVRGILQRR
jgi:hypothetical protein